MAESGEDKDVTIIAAPLMQWAGVEPGESTPEHGSMQLLLVSLMNADMSIQNVCLQHDQGHDAVMSLLNAMNAQGCGWANAVLSVLQQAQEQGAFGDINDDGTNNGEAEEGSASEEPGLDGSDENQEEVRQEEFDDDDTDDPEDPDHNEDLSSDRDTD